MADDNASITQVSKLNDTTSTPDVGLVTAVKIDVPEKAPFSPPHDITGHGDTSDDHTDNPTDQSSSLTIRDMVDNDTKGSIRFTPASRKPTTFKAVSINEKFLSAKATTTQNTAKNNNKDITNNPTLSISANHTIPLSAGRPRLVAKSGPGLRDTPSYRSSLNHSGAQVPTPDPYAVWNKNRPTPPVDPRTYTDEELKRYGIHMANRLSAEDVPGQSNWADIADDDDDWAPDTIITWTDGTKIELSAPEDAQSFVGTQAVSGLKQPDLATTPGTMKTTDGEIGVGFMPTDVPKGVTAISDTAAGGGSAGFSHTKHSVSAVGGKGLVFKSGGVTDRLLPSEGLHSNSASVKSPWAKLPPVDSASPGTIARDEMARHGHRPRVESIANAPPLDRSITSSISSSAAASRPIEVDDFGKPSWRYTSSHMARELYNSQSGQYESIRMSDGRGHNSRLDAAATKQHYHHHKQPLTKKIAGVEATPAAEFSNPPATSIGGDITIDDQGGPSKSSVDGNSFVELNQHSQPILPDGDHGEKSSGHESRYHENRVTQQTSSLDDIQHTIAYRGSSPSRGPISHNNWPSRAPCPPGPFQHQSTDLPFADPSADPRVIVPQVPTSPSSDGATPLKATTTQQVLLAELDDQKRIMREKRELAIRRRKEEEAKEEAERKERIRLKLETLGPPPERKASGTGAARPREDGLEIDNKPLAQRPIAPNSSEQRVSTNFDATGSQQIRGDAWHVSHSHDDETRATTGGLPVNRDNDPSVDPRSGPDLVPTRSIIERGAINKQPPRQTSLTTIISGSELDPVESWNTITKRDNLSPISSWNSDRHQAAIRNVWASPNNDRGLGNGTFNPDLGRVPEVSLQSSSKSQHLESLGAVGPTNAPPSSRPPRCIPAPAGRDPNESIPDARNSWASSVIHSDLCMQETEAMKCVGRGPPSVTNSQPQIKDTWRPVQRTVQHPGVASKSNGVSTTHPDTRIDKTTPGPREKHSRDDAQDSSFHGHESTPDISQQSSLSTVGIPSSKSRFFPAERISCNDNAGYPILPSTSPPPPTAMGHPVYDGDATNPLVSLPKPQPIVRLPPTTIDLSSNRSARLSENTLHSVEATLPSHKASASITAAPLKGSANWQDKINNLLRPDTHTTHKTTSADGLAIPGLGAALKHNNLDTGLAYLSDQAMNVVARPCVASKNEGVWQTIPCPTNIAQITPTTKNMSEDCFEQQEMGSLPQVHIPHRVPIVWGPSPVPMKTIPRKFMIVAQTRDIFAIPIDTTAGNNTIVINIPGVSTPRLIAITKLDHLRSLSGSLTAPPCRGNNQRNRGNIASQGNSYGSSRMPGGRKLRDDASMGTRMPSAVDTIPRGSRGGHKARQESNNRAR
jgi:hypothetical protein